MPRKLYSYPTTPHLPWSLQVSRADKRLTDITHFIGKQVVVTEKMDGENTTLYRHTSHARSVDSRHHPSRSWLKQFWSERQHLLNDDMRVCGENLFAKHSIYYESLLSYFLGFSVWENEVCLDWQSTLEVLQILGIEPVPVLYEGPFNEELIKGLYREGTEGYVVRVVDIFLFNEFERSIAKFVRKGHVQTDDHWQYQTIIPNKLRGNI